MLTDNSLTFKHLGARLFFFTELLVRMLLYILLTTNCITLSSFLTNNLMRPCGCFSSVHLVNKQMCMFF